MKKLIAISLVAMLLCGSSAQAFWGHGHYYRDAGWWGLGGFVTGLAVGTYVASLPPDYDTVVINGVPYYYADGYYYETSPNGYMVVTPPGSGGHTIMIYILEILGGIVLLLCIGLLLKKLLREPRAT